MIAEFYCDECTNVFEIVILNQKKFESTKAARCPECSSKANKIDHSMPARFMGTFGVDNTAPSKRYSYKKVVGGENGNKGSAC